MAQIDKYNPYDLTSQLLSFRLAYLQAVARAWREPEFKEKILSNPDMPGGRLINVLEVDEFTALIEPADILDSWQVKIHIMYDEKMQYQPFNAKTTNGWLASGHEVLGVFIPEKPQIASDKTTEAQLLAEYYQRFPTAFGNYIQTSFREDSNAGTGFHPKIKEFQQARASNVDNELGIGGASQFLAFGAVCQYITGRCWADEAYFEFINGKVISSIGTSNSVFQDDVVRFENPWGLNIQFHKCKVDLQESEGGVAWQNIPFNELRLMFPNAPQEPQQPVALARYNSAGPNFPFTCCIIIEH